MDYIKELDKNNVGLKTTLKKIFKDIDKRLKETSDDETSDDEKNGGENTGTEILGYVYNDDGWNLYNTPYEVSGFIIDDNGEEKSVEINLDWRVVFQDGSVKNGTTFTTGGEFSFEFMCDVLGSATLTISFKGDETYAPYTDGHTFDIVEQNPYIKPDGE